MDRPVERWRRLKGDTLNVHREDLNDLENPKKLDYRIKQGDTLGATGGSSRRRVSSAPEGSASLELVTVAILPPLMELPPRGRPMSFEDWLAMDEDEPGELVDGHLEEEEVPDYVHELTVSFLVFVLRGWLGSTGFVVGSEAKMRLHQKTGRKPDLIVHLPGSPAPPRKGALKAPPDIVVEVVTPTSRDERRDRVEKRLEYAHFGVRWYWLVDPALGTFEILELEADGLYKLVATATSGVIDRVPGCNGLRLDIDQLWAELARLGPAEG